MKVDAETAAKWKNKPIEAFCPDCGAQLVIRVNGITEELFLGCSNFERGRCRYTTNKIPTFVEAEINGQPSLF